MLTCICVQVSLPYHVRVLIPCYKESVPIVSRTVKAAIEAPLPAGCSRTVWPCLLQADCPVQCWWMLLKPHPLMESEWAAAASWQRLGLPLPLTELVSRQCLLNCILCRASLLTGDGR